MKRDFQNDDESLHVASLAAADEHPKLRTASIGDTKLSSQSHRVIEPAETAFFKHQR